MEEIHFFFAHEYLQASSEFKIFFLHNQLCWTGFPLLPVDLTIEPFVWDKLEVNGSVWERCSWSVLVPPLLWYWVFLLLKPAVSPWAMVS